MIRPSLDYTSKDFDALRDRLFNVIPSAFPTWTDRQVADFGNLMVEMMAFVGDVIAFYQDNQARESRWSTARLRRSMISMAKLISFGPTGASAAQCDLTIQLAASPVGSVTINAGDVFRTKDAVNPVRFQALSSVTIPAQSDPPTAVVTVENSAAAQDIVQSTALPNQQYTLGETPYLDGSLTITADEGVFTLVDDLIDSGPTDRHAVVTVDENDRALVKFGDGVAGSIPNGAITFNYKTGGGSAGNVVAGAISKAETSYVDSFGNPVVLTVTNLAKAGGGLERQTVEGMRSAAPRSVRVQTRTVGREDYEINALRVPGVARALMMSKDEKPSVLENNGELYLVPAGGGAASSAMIDAVNAMITTTFPKTITFRLSIFTASYLVINITCRLHLAKGAIAGVVGPAVRAALTLFFAIKNADGSDNTLVNFGYYMDGALAWSDVFDVIRDTPGVRKIDDGLANLTINGASKDLTLLPEQFPILGTITLVDAVTGQALP